MENITVQIITKPQRKVLIKRGTQAEDYFTYCEEVGCDIWDRLLELCPEGAEPVCLWLPDKFIASGTSRYVQGVEVCADYTGPIPADFDTILLPQADYLQFRGQPFEEETFPRAIEEVWTAMASFDPSPLGYAWDDENPRVQLEPRCERGYVELRAVRRL